MVYEIITGEDLELWYRDKGTVRPGEIELMKRYKKHLQSSYRGDLHELEVEGFLRERFTEMRATELVIKTRSSLTPRQMYQKEVLRIRQKQWPQFETFLLQVHQVL